MRKRVVVELRSRGPVLRVVSEPRDPAREGVDRALRVGDGRPRADADRDVAELLDEHVELRLVVRLREQDVLLFLSREQNGVEL